jgi:hypothetical protein
MSSESRKALVGSEGLEMANKGRNRPNGGHLPSSRVEPANQAQSQLTAQPDRAPRLDKVPRRRAQTLETGHLAVTADLQDLTTEQWLEWRDDLVARMQRRLAIHHAQDRAVDFSDLEQERDDLLAVRDAYEWLGKWPPREEGRQ